MKTTLFGLTILIASVAPITAYIFKLSGLGGMYGKFWKQFPPFVYISTNLIIHLVVSFSLALLVFHLLDLKNRIPSPVAGKYLIWVGGFAMFFPLVLRVFTSMIPGGGASFALMSISAPIVLLGKIIFYSGFFFLLLAIKPNEKYTYLEP